MTFNNGKWARWGIGLLITVLLFLGANVIANDKDSRARDERLGEEIGVLETDVKDVLQTVLIKVTEIDVKQQMVLERIKDING